MSNTGAYIQPNARWSKTICDDDKCFNRFYERQYNESVVVQNFDLEGNEYTPVGVPDCCDFSSGVTTVIEYASVKTALQTDLNNSPIQFRDVIVSPLTLDTNIAGVGALATGLTGIPAGAYLVFASVFLSSGSPRPNLILAPRIGASVPEQGPRGSTGYIRNSNGHNSSSISIAGKIIVPAISEVGVQAIREANAGAVASFENQGEITLIRIV